MIHEGVHFHYITYMYDIASVALECRPEDILLKPIILFQNFHPLSGP